MFDTVCLSHAMHPRLSERELMHIRAERPKGRTAYVINPAAGETFPALTWQTQPNGVQYLSARFSLPRQRWGHNARLPKSQVDVFAGLGIAAQAIYNATGIIFDPLSANVTEVHYAVDIHVGADRVRPVLDRLELRQLPRHIRIRLDHGVEFKQRQSSTQIYAKYYEVKVQTQKGHIKPQFESDALEAAEGVLRIEHRQRLPAVDRTQKRHKLGRSVSEVLTPDATERIIGEKLNALQFADAVNNAEADDVLDRLIQYHGVNRALTLSGFLQTMKSYGPNFYQVLAYPRRTYYRNLSLCKAAGVWAGK